MAQKADCSQRQSGRSDAVVEPLLRYPFTTRINCDMPFSESKNSYQTSSRTPTPNKDCFSDISAANVPDPLKPTSSPVNKRTELIKPQTIIMRPNPIFERLIASTRSPTAWQPKHPQGSRSVSMRPAFVYCGPGSRRVPGMSAITASTASSGRSSVNCRIESIMNSTTPNSQMNQDTNLTSDPVCHVELEELVCGSTPKDGKLNDGHPGHDLPAVSIQGVGDENKKRYAVDFVRRRSSRRNQGSPTVLRGDHTPGVNGTESRPFTALWRGPEFSLEKASSWWIVSDVSNKVPSSEDVALTGLILTPASCIKLKEGASNAIMIEPDKLFGIIRVHNHAFEKSVTVRASGDKWMSYLDQPAKYIMSIDQTTTSQNKYDLFAFRFALPENSEEFEFAIHYRWWNPEGGGSCWDNNACQNYLLRRRKEIILDKLGSGMTNDSTKTTE